MPYMVIQDFRDGLDSRKSILSAPAGSLQTCVNAHITRGGEIEKRKAFVLQFVLPPNTFGLKGSRGQLYVFGSAAPPPMPPGVNYQQLASPTGSSMIKLVQAENYGGKPYVVAQYDDGSVFHFYNGVRVTDLDVVAVGASDLTSAASRLASLINSAGSYNATSANNAIIITAVEPGVPFAIAGGAYNGGSVADESTAIYALQNNVDAVEPVFGTGSFDVTGGNDASTNFISGVEAGGNEILGANVLYSVDNETTAALISAQINAFGSGGGTGFSATSSGQTVIIQAPVIGAAYNGWSITAVAHGSVTVGNGHSIAGGVDLVWPVAQIYEAVLGGSSEPGDEYWIELDGNLFNTTVLGSGYPSSVRTYNEKMYGTNTSLLEFSKINDPTLWQPAAEVPANTGAGNINMSNQDAGSEALVAIGIFQNQLAIFSRTNTQLWTVDSDPANNKLAQNMPNIGTMALNSVTAFGDTDLFFLSDTGIRSLKIRVYTAFAAVSDVGTAIDTLVVKDMQENADGTVADACGVMEPRDGRYLLALGNTIYVFSFFPSSKISAWSTYDLGFEIQHWTVIGQYLYARSGDSVFLYGGFDLATYDDCDVEVELPYLDNGKPANDKSLTGIDFGIEGKWDVFVGTDPTQPDLRDKLGTVTRETYGLLAVPASGSGTHIGLRLTSSSPGYARLATATIHYTDDGTN